MREHLWARASDAVQGKEMTCLCQTPGFPRLSDCSKAFAGCIWNDGKEECAAANWLADSRPESELVLSSTVRH